MTGKVIRLEFKSPHVKDDTMAFLSCSACSNKTYTLTVDDVNTFPLARCAACGQHIGRMGWYYDEDPEHDPASSRPKPPPPGRSA
jgi:hypothetical protein